MSAISPSTNKGINLDVAVNKEYEPESLSKIMEGIERIDKENVLIVFNSYECFDSHPSGIHMFYYVPARSSKIVRDFMDNFLELIDGMVINGNTWIDDRITDEEEFIATGEITTHRDIPLSEQFVCDMSLYCSALMSYLENNDKATYSPIDEDHMALNLPNEFYLDWSIEFCKTFLLCRTTGSSHLKQTMPISRIVYCGFVP